MSLVMPRESRDRDNDSPTGPRPNSAGIGLEANTYRISSQIPAGEFGALRIAHASAAPVRRSAPGASRQTGPLAAAWPHHKIAHPLESLLPTSLPDTPPGRKAAPRHTRPP